MPVLRTTDLFSFSRYHFTDQFPEFAVELGYAYSLDQSIVTRTRADCDPREKVVGVKASPHPTRVYRPDPYRLPTPAINSTFVNAVHHLYEADDEQRSKEI
jgi:hypothetical protein